jgi:hypothetical protein
MDINYGDIIEYRNDDGHGRIVRVSHVSENLDGMGPGFDGVIQDYEGATDTFRDSDMPFRSVWGLHRQVVRVVRPA